MGGLKPHCEELRTAFADGGTGFASKASESAGSMLLGPDLQLAQRVMSDPNDLCRHLDAAGFDLVSTGRFDLAGYQDAWSSPVARDLLIAHRRGCRSDRSSTAGRHIAASSLSNKER
jgi:hypothetical protein